MKNEPYIAALELELAGYEATGKKDRAAEVRKELARVTGKTAKATPAKKTAAAPTPAETAVAPVETAVSE